MRIVLASGQRLLRPDADLSDLTDSRRDGGPWWDGTGTLVLPFTPEPTPAEQTLIRRRLMTRDADHEAWVAATTAELALLPDSTPAARMLRLIAVEYLRGIDRP